MSVDINYVWKDKKRIFGMPISFTNYALSEDRLFEKIGLFSTKQNETLLYRIKDISLKRTLWQKMFGVGTIIIYTVDSSTPIIVVKNICTPEEVKEMLHQSVEREKVAKGMRFGEFYDT